MGYALTCGWIPVYAVSRRTKAEVFMRIAVVIITLALLSPLGCARLGARVEPLPLPPGAPAVGDVLSGLAENDTALRTFRATGTVMIKSPEVESVQVSRESVLHYRHPNQLYVIGRRYGTRFIELVHADDAFIIEFPTRREYCHRATEERFDTLSTADIVREMFQPEAWGDLSQRHTRIASYDAATQTATIEIWEMGPTPWLRRIVVAQGAPWVVLESKRLDRNGETIAHTIKSSYHELNQVRYPGEIECSFPGEAAWMRFVMRRVDVNIPLDDTLFDVDARAAAAARRGFTRVDIFAGEGPDIEAFAE